MMKSMRTLFLASAAVGAEAAVRLFSVSPEGKAEPLKDVSVEKAVIRVATNVNYEVKEKVLTPVPTPVEAAKNYVVAKGKISEHPVLAKAKAAAELGASEIFVVKNEAKTFFAADKDAVKDLDELLAAAVELAKAEEPAGPAISAFGGDDFTFVQDVANKLFAEDVAAPVEVVVGDDKSVTLATPEAKNKATIEFKAVNECEGLKELKAEGAAEKRFALVVGGLNYLIVKGGKATADQAIAKSKEVNPKAIDAQASNCCCCFFIIALILVALIATVLVVCCCCCADEEMGDEDDF